MRIMINNKIFNERILIVKHYNVISIIKSANEASFQADKCA